VNTEKTSLLEQVGFWSLLGPFIMLVTLTILLLNPLQQNLVIPGIALISLPLCWKWKNRGLYTALSLLGCVLLYQLWNAPSEQIFWDLLLGAAAALTFTITMLCSQEVDALISPLQEEAFSRQQNLLEANEKVQELEKQLEVSIAGEIANAKLFQQKLNEADMRVHASEKASLVVRDKSAAIAAQNESLLRELFQKRHEYEKLLQQMQSYEAEKQMQQASSHETEKEVEILQLETVPPSKPGGKSKSAKSSKTNNWANTILSRWSEPHDLSQ
jgi:hypothetical protein